MTQADDKLPSGQLIPALFSPPSPLVEEISNMASINISLDVGTSFPNFKCVKDVLEARTQVLNERWKIASGSRTVKQANSGIKDVKRHFKDEFKYAFVFLRCINEGGYKTRGKNIRKKK